MKTKKFLVAYNPKKPAIRSSDFVIPITDKGKLKFLGLTSGKHFDYGMLVLTGKEVTVNDVFAKLIDTGRKVESVDETMSSIASYFELLKEFKISNVVKIIEDSTLEHGFNFKKEAFKSSTKRKSLP